MLLRISLIIAILAGIGTIVVTQMQARKQVITVIEQRNENIQRLVSTPVARVLSCATRAAAPLAAPRASRC